ncbi:MAG: hypothetical protein FK734_13455 [Asgard group archaeon]|nr:hypothetical protein [Asgard group archaeon]
MSNITDDSKPKTKIAILQNVLFWGMIAGSIAVIPEIVVILLDRENTVVLILAIIFAIIMILQFITYVTVDIVRMKKRREEKTDF